MNPNPWSSRLGVACWANPPTAGRKKFRKIQITETETLEILSNLQLDDGGGGTPAHMTPDNQSREDVVRPMTFLLHPRQTTKIATWNIYTMYRAGRMAQIAEEMSSLQVFDSISLTS